MPVWQWVAEAIVAVLVIVLLVGVGLVVRRRLLARHGGTFELSHRVRTQRPERGWVLGIGRYSGDELEWFRIFSLSPRPRSTWHRRSMSYLGRRDPEGDEQVSLYAEHVVVRCQTADGLVELAMSQPSLTGFQSWLEAGPPGAEMP